MLKIGITGGIGSGKSLVAQMFAVLGAPVFDADKEAKLIMETDASVRNAVIQAFGEGSYTDAKLNRGYLANIVFKDPFQLEVLNSIVHPATIERANKWFKLFNVPYVVKEAALLFEAGTATGLDYVIGVTAPTHLRIQRAMERDGLTREDVLNRMERQVDDEIKMRLCNFVIVNDERNSIIKQVVNLHEQFSRMSNS